MLSRQLSQEGLELHVKARKGFATGQYLALHNPAGDLAAACVDDRVLSEAPEDLFDGIVADLAANATDDTIWFLDANLPAAMLVRLTGRALPGRLVANAVSDAKAVRLHGVLGKLDCLMLNRGEAVTLTGLSRETSSEDLAAALSQTGLKSFVLTSAASDVLVLESGELHRFAPFQTDIVDVTGAGDALTAGTVAALARGYGLTQAVPFGLAAAALTLRSTGASRKSSPGMPSPTLTIWIKFQSWRCSTLRYKTRRIDPARAAGRKQKGTRRDHSDNALRHQGSDRLQR